MLISINNGPVETQRIEQLVLPMEIRVTSWRRGHLRWSLEDEQAFDRQRVEEENVRNGRICMHKVLAL